MVPAHVPDSHVPPHAADSARVNPSAPARLVAGRRAWLVLVLLVLAAGAVIGLGGSSTTSQAPDNLPPDAESAQVAAMLAQFPGGDTAPAIAVATRVDGGALTGADLAALTQARARMLAVDRRVPAAPASSATSQPSSAASPAASSPAATRSPAASGAPTTARPTSSPSSAPTSSAPAASARTATGSPSAAQASPGQPSSQPSAQPSSAGGAPAAGGGAPPVIPSPDGRAATILAPVAVDVSGAELAEVVDQLRTSARDGLPADLTLSVTGGPAFGADIAGAFSGADVRLLIVTALVVAVLLLLTYRSPILWIVPLLVVAIADRLATVVAGQVATGLGFVVDGSTGGITSVLVFGAGTNYALLIVSRYREELRREPDHRLALARAVHAATPAVLASNITVVLALLTLLLAVLPNTRVLGLCAAVGLFVALITVLIGLPAALSVCGRGLFWPFVPRVGDPDPSVRGAWHTVADAVVRRPWRALAVTLPVLALCAAGLSGIKVGLEQTQQFRVTAESVTGFETLREHLPAGSVTPTTVVARTPTTTDLEQIQELIATTPGVESVTTAGRLGDLTQQRVVLDAEPASEAAFTTIRDLRDRIAADRLDAQVGGADAEQLDSRDGAERDLRVLVPLILGVVLAVLFVLLRAAWAPLLLIGATIASTIAAIGAGTWVSTHVFGFPAIDVSVPLFAVLFLVALGVDYTIFLVIRAREEAAEHGTRPGVVRAVALTGGVITSAGIVLAAVFAVLGVLPLITLTQLGIVVGIGILLDTFLVRTIVVPAIVSLMGDRFWWPTRPTPHAH